MNERTATKLLRIALKFLSWVVLMIYVIFDIAVPLYKGDDPQMTSTDGVVILVSLLIILAIDSLKSIVIRVLSKRTGADDE